jgi:hypothetical protein
MQDKIFNLIFQKFKFQNISYIGNTEFVSFNPDSSEYENIEIDSIESIFQQKIDKKLIYEKEINIQLSENDYQIIGNFSGYLWAKSIGKEEEFISEVGVSCIDVNINLGKTNWWEKMISNLDKFNLNLSKCYSEIIYKFKKEIDTILFENNLEYFTIINYKYDISSLSICNKEKEPICRIFFTNNSFGKNINLYEYQTISIQDLKRNCIYNITKENVEDNSKIISFINKNSRKEENVYTKLEWDIAKKKFIVSKF